MKLEDVDEARASWMKLEMVCIQLCQGAVSVGCTDKPYIVDSVPDHMVVVAFQKLAAFIPVVVQEPLMRELVGKSQWPDTMGCTPLIQRRMSQHGFITILNSLC